MSHFTELLLIVWCGIAVGHSLQDAIGEHQQAKSSVVPRLPVADGLLHVYALPIGQGDSHVIQCPSGTLTIVDLGSSDEETSGFWHVPELQNYFQGQYHLIRNVVLTHNHYDHYVFIPDVLDPTSADLSGLQEIYISCTYDDLVDMIKTWLAQLPGGGTSYLRTFNGGQVCGPNGVACEPLNLCPNDPEVEVLVMAANLGQQCSVADGNDNIDSMVFKVTHQNVSIMFNGDFEDFTTDWYEDGPQQSLVDYYGDEMQVTVYKLSHHGADYLANKPVSRDAHAPKAVFVSSNPWYVGDYRHPRCSVTDAFIQYVQSLCKPEITDGADPLYCGEHPQGSLPVEDRVQRVYTCGESEGLRTVTDNDWAMYSTVPDEFTMNLVELQSDGVRWGFVNTFSPRIVRQ